MVVWMSLPILGHGDLLLALVGKTRFFITKSESTMVENGFLFQNNEQASLENTLHTINSLADAVNDKLQSDVSLILSGLSHRK